jgi:hypothetical protein
MEYGKTCIAKNLLEIKISKNSILLSLNKKAKREQKFLLSGN